MSKVSNSSVNQGTLSDRLIGPEIDVQSVECVRFKTASSPLVLHSVRVGNVLLHCEAEPKIDSITVDLICEQVLSEAQRQGKKPKVMIADTVLTGDFKSGSGTIGLIQKLVQKGVEVHYYDHHLPDSSKPSGQDYMRDLFSVKKLVGASHCVVKPRAEAYAVTSLLGSEMLRKDEFTFYLCAPADLDGFMSGLIACGLNPDQLNRPNDLATAKSLGVIDSGKQYNVSTDAHDQGRSIADWLCKVRTLLLFERRNPEGLQQVMSEVALSVSIGSITSQLKDQFTYIDEVTEVTKVLAKRFLIDLSEEKNGSILTFNSKISRQQMDQLGKDLSPHKFRIARALLEDGGPHELGIHSLRHAIEDLPHRPHSGDFALIMARAHRPGQAENKSEWRSDVVLAGAYARLANLQELNQSDWQKKIREDSDFGTLDRVLFYGSFRDSAMFYTRNLLTVLHVVKNALKSADLAIGKRNDIDARSLAEVATRNRRGG